MTAVSAPLSARERDASEGRALPLRPSEGWLVVALLFVMLAMFARAIDDAAWAGLGADGTSATSFLNWAVLLGGAYGLIAAKTRLPALAAHLLGAVLATGFLLVAVAGVISSAPTLPARIDDLVLSLGRFYYDLVIEGIRSRETSAFLLALGAIGWTTGHFAAFNLFRRHRVLSTVLITGLAMLTQVSVTIEAQYSYLVIFIAAALLLVVRMNLFEQRAGWERRRIGDWGDVSSLYMRSGLTFVIFALVGSIALAAAASSAPLASAWRDADNDLVRLGGEVNRIVGGVTGAARGPQGLFGPSQTIRGVWESSTSVVFRAATSDGEGRYWRAATYDAFDGATWLQIDRDAGVRIAPGDQLLEVTSEAVPPDEEGRGEVDSTIVGIDYVADILVAPDAPLAVDRTADVFANSPGGPLAGIELAQDIRTGESYTVTSLVRLEGEENGGLTENKLAAAGVGYPEWVRRYIAIREGSVGELTYETAEGIVDDLPEDQRDPYHVAFAVQDYLYASGGFRYRTDVRGLCGNEQLVDCFLRTKVGYCEYFATAMVMLLRTQQIPARMVLGYLPGRQLDDGSWQVDRSAAHAWVEVYFPGYGWVQFDPTPGNRENAQRPTVLEEGEPVARPEPGAIASPSFIPGGPLDPLPRDRPPAGPADQPGGRIGFQLPLAVLAALGVLAVLLGAIGRRRWQAGTEPDVAYQGMARLAGRFGYGPRPTETAYEYAGALGDLVPAVRDDLQTVARAKVETTYARRTPADDFLEALARAYRRVRLGLLALALRRAGRGKLGRPGEPRTRLRS